MTIEITYSTPEGVNPVATLQLHMTAASGIPMAGDVLNITKSGVPLVVSHRVWTARENATHVELVLTHLK